eukprot:2735629-Rhodomonas_salina.7
MSATRRALGLALFVACVAAFNVPAQVTFVLCFCVGVGLRVLTLLHLCAILHLCAFLSGVCQHVSTRSRVLFCGQLKFRHRHRHALCSSPGPMPSDGPIKPRLRTNNAKDNRSFCQLLTWSHAHSVGSSRTPDKASLAKTLVSSTQDYDTKIAQV